MAILDAYLLMGFCNCTNSRVMACSGFTQVGVRLGFKKHFKFVKSCYPRRTLPPVMMPLLNFNQRLTCVRKPRKSKFTWISWLIAVQSHYNLWICGLTDSLTIDLTFDYQANVFSWRFFPKTYGVPMFVVSQLFFTEAGSPTIRRPCCDGFLIAGIPLKSAHRRLMSGKTFLSGCISFSDLRIQSQIA